MKLLLSNTLIFLFYFSAEAQYATYITVAADGSGDYSSIQSAINDTKSFPDQKITIFIKKGIYREKVRIYPWNTNLQLIGADQDSTIIIWDDHFKKINQGRNSTFQTYTVSVEANDCVLSNLTIRNSAGPIGQAIALSVSGDRIVIKQCILLGNQDTVYCTGEGNRQYFSDCYIEGTTDYIFGNAIVFLEKCQLHSLSNSFITAASTTINQDYGFVFRQCKLTAAEGVDRVYLGRPWRTFAKTVFISCDYGSHILAEGWNDWGKESNQKTAYYGEYAPGYDLKNRVSWSKKITKKEANRYTSARVFRDWRVRE